MNPLSPYPITPIGCFIGIMLAAVPLPLQFQSSNIGVFMYGIWLAVMNLTLFVNTIIWHDNVNIVAPIWCDIVTRIQFGVSSAIRGCTLAICIRLYKITRSRASDVTITRAIKRKAVLPDLFLTVCLPLLIIGLYIIIQPIRFQIVEEVGCGPVVYSFVTYIIEYLPEFVLSGATLCLAIATTRVFLAHRKEMNEFLSSDPNMPRSKYKRLIIIAFLDTVVNVPIMIILLCQTVASGDESAYNHPYVGWDSIHHGAGGAAPGSSLSTILQVPASDWSSDSWSFFSAKWDEWVYVLHALAFFAVFGTAPEMIRRYREIFWFIPERLGYRRKVEVQETMSEIRFDSGPTRAARGNMSTLLDPASIDMGVYSNASAGTHVAGVTGFCTACSEAEDKEIGVVDAVEVPNLKKKMESSSVSESGSIVDGLKVEGAVTSL